MEEMNTNVVMENEVEGAAVDTESTGKISAGKVLGVVAGVGLAGYGLYKLGKKLVGICKDANEARKAKKAATAKENAVELIGDDVTTND